MNAKAKKISMSSSRFVPITFVLALYAARAGEGSSHFSFSKAFP